MVAITSFLWQHRGSVVRTVDLACRLPQLIRDGRSRDALTEAKAIVALDGKVPTRTDVRISGFEDGSMLLRGDLPLDQLRGDASHAARGRRCGRRPHQPGRRSPPSTTRWRRHSDGRSPPQGAGGRGRRAVGGGAPPRAAPRGHPHDTSSTPRVSCTARSSAAWRSGSSDEVRVGDRVPHLAAGRSSRWPVRGAARRRTRSAPASTRLIEGGDDRRPRRGPASRRRRPRAAARTVAPPWRTSPRTRTSR